MQSHSVVTGAFLLMVPALGVYSCKDMGSDPVKTRLTASVFSVTLSPGETATLTIHGGNPPYSISKQPDPSLVTHAVLTPNTDGTAALSLQAVSAGVSGVTGIRVKDSGTHSSSIGQPVHEENEIEITITVAGTAQISFSSDVQPMFTLRCVNAGCHPGNGAPFPLAAGVSYAQLVNVNATTGPCSGIKRVLPGSPDNSALIRRLEGNCGALMPLGGSAIPASEIQRLRSWIAQGAQNN